MSFLAQIKDLIATPEAGREPRIAVFGDSHTAALIRARSRPSSPPEHKAINIVRLRKEKHGKTVGDSDLAGFCRAIRSYRSTDSVFSAVGGNQYAVVSTVQGAIDYDFLSSPADQDISSDRAELVPLRAIAGYIDEGVRGTVGPVLEEIRKSTKAKLFHLAPPPPKQDNDFIAQHFESRFAEDGIHELGPSRPDLRLKCWRIQLDSLSRLCKELGIGLVVPPGKCVTAEGYLARPYYAKDVTHANGKYGVMVLNQILKFAGVKPKAAGPGQ